MPWEVHPVSEIRLAFVHQVLSLHTPVAAACRTFGISRKTGHKWLRRYHADPAQPLADGSRRPHACPGRTAGDLETAILKVRDEFGWGPRKIHASLRPGGLALPSVRTVAAILRRHGRIGPPAAPPPPLRRFERARPNELWQCDFKGFLEVARRRVCPFTALDDHSRYLFTVHPCLDQTMQTAWDILWRLFGEVGLPDALLCDNAFGNRHQPPGLSWFEARLLRLGVRPVHGRPYHPQTQGKLERLHRTLEDEVWPRVRREALDLFAQDVERWRTAVYNSCRPHEALGDVPPLTRWTPSPRPRPAALPPAVYAAGAVLRKVGAEGAVAWHQCRLLVGQGLAGEQVRLEERDQELAVFYTTKLIRRVPLAALRRDRLA
jgi:transposase InsO family protein